MGNVKKVTLSECASHGSNSDGNQVWRKDNQTESYLKETNWKNKIRRNTISPLHKKSNNNKMKQ
jgi:hypothetical protein